MKILLTGAAGFIGMHTSLRLLARGDEVVGVDNLNDYYDVSLKAARLARLTPHKNFRFHKLSVEDKEGMARLFRDEKPDRVIHLAAQAGVRYSLTNPHAYMRCDPAGVHQYRGGLPAHGGATPGVRQQLQRLRRQHQHAFLGAPEHRRPRQLVCRVEEGERVDGAHVQPFVPSADHGTEVLHRGPC